MTEQNADSADSRSGQIAQTLDRGLQILETLSQAPDGMTITQLATEQGLHRSIAARLLVTLDKRGFVTRSPDGRYRLGYTVFTLARTVSNNAILATTPLMVEAATELNATIVYHVADGHETITIGSIEPPSGAFRLGMRPGARHPIEVAAHGMAILAGREPRPGERPEITEARRLGYAVSVGEVLPGFAGVCAPIMISGRTDSSVGCVVPRERSGEFEKLGAAVIDLAHRMSLIFG